MKPDTNTIAAEVAKLTEIKPKVRHYSAFGDNNRASIDAQIAVLKNNLPVYTIYDIYHIDDETNGRLDAALVARSWLDGEKDTVPPSEDWASLVDA